MKKLLLLLLLFGFNANGADKAILSDFGLEGIAKYGIKVYAEDYSKRDETFDRKAIDNQVELRLVQAGIKIIGITQTSGTAIGIDANPIEVGSKVVGYAVTIEAVREMTFSANGKTYYHDCGVWNMSKAVVPKDGLRESINKIMDQFLLDYLKANPKKKED